MNKKTILIAEDNDSNYMYLWMLLRGDYNVIRAVNGTQAVESVKKNDSIDLVLMDIKMPEMTGVEATEIIRQFNPTIPIVMQTSFAFDQDIELAMRKGASAYLTKPVLRDPLFAELHRFGL
ncbi:MAG: response regulator [Bacteroidaceae bacterium]|nr:response regulator [Bacteroidaceae bacterium]